SKSPYSFSVMTMPPLPGMSCEPTMAPSSMTHLPPVVFLLPRLWPAFAETFQPLSVLPSVMETKPSSENFSGGGGSAGRRAARMAIERQIAASFMMRLRVDWRSNVHQSFCEAVRSREGSPPKIALSVAIGSQLANGIEQPPFLTLSPLGRGWFASVASKPG